MRKLFGKAGGFISATVTHVKAAVCRSRSVLAESGGEGFVDTAVKILMAVVIGALVLAGLYLLFSGTILPTLTQRIQEMFNYRG
jgi:hypothetical protein